MNAQDAKGMVVFDFSTLQIENYFGDLKSGCLTYVSGTPDLTLLAKGNGLGLEIVNYADGKIEKNASAEFYIFAIKNIYQSSFVLLATGSVVSIYDVSSGSFETPVLLYDVVESISALGFNFRDSSLDVVGSKLGLKIVFSGHDE